MYSSKRYAPYKGDARDDEDGDSYNAGTKVFVGNLPWDIEWKDLKDVCAQGGEVRVPEAPSAPPWAAAASAPPPPAPAPPAPRSLPSFPSASALAPAPSQLICTVADPARPAFGGRRWCARTS